MPTYDIDCVWHAHQLHPHDYIADTERLCGAALPHDDSVNDRSDGSRLNDRWKATRDAWKAEFKESGPANAGGSPRCRPQFMSKLYAK